MKAVRIILITIIVLSAIFFATGLLFKQLNYTTSITINKPVKKVFKKFNDVNNLKKWMPEIESIKTIFENPEKTGSEYLLTVNNNGEKITLKERILAFEENKKVTLLYDISDFEKIDDFVFEAKDSTTYITKNTSLNSKKFILSCLFPYFKSNFVEEDQHHLNDLKKFIEEDKK